MHKKIGKRSIVIALVVILNIALAICVISSVLSAFRNSERVSFFQNIENVRTLTNASANKVELELDHCTQELAIIAQYVNQYHGVGMTEKEMQEYFTALYSNQEAFSWQLVNNKAENPNTSRHGFPAIGLCDEAMVPFIYRVESYPELAKIFAVAAEDTMGDIQKTNEFTDASPAHEKSTALTTTVRVRTEDGYQYKTLVYLLESGYINEMISNNNEIDTWNFFDYSNIIIDNSGNYVISNHYFQGTNIMDYIGLYNDEFGEKEKETLGEKLKQENYSEVLYYQNNKEQDCAYTIVPVQNSDWHILSIVPISSFHHTYDFSDNFLRFAIALLALFALDIAVVLIVNRRLRQLTREAKEANASKSRFLSSMSHDIRTPMNAIIGMTVIAEKQLEEEHVDHKALGESIQMIKLSGNHLLTLINDVLDISKIESGMVVLRPIDFSITDAIHKMIRINQVKIEEKQFVFETHISDIQHEYVTGDMLRVSQIFGNILSNALKYTQPGGKIVVELTEQSVPEKAHMARYTYKVSDTGIGMSPEFVDTIFQRFTRAVDTRINAVQGTGLGMAIVKQLVTLLGGSIEVESKLDVGSVFTVTLDFPIAQEALELNEDDIIAGDSVPDDEHVTGSEEPHVSKKQPVSAGRHVSEEYTASAGQVLVREQTVIEEHFPELRILAAEDNDINWKVLNKILMYYGVNAQRAENGAVTVEKVRSADSCYDLILMDIQMPVMNGYEATRAIRSLEDEEKASTVIYAMTADTFNEDIKRCEEAGMNGHLAKPIDVERVVALLREISQRKG